MAGSNNAYVELSRGDDDDDEDKVDVQSVVGQGHSQTRGKQRRNRRTSKTGHTKACSHF